MERAKLTLNFLERKKAECEQLHWEIDIIAREAGVSDMRNKSNKWINKKAHEQQIDLLFAPQA